MSRLLGLGLLAGLLMVAPPPAFADVTVKIDVSDQRMRVYVNGHRQHSWAVSTGRSGYRTPRGHYRPTRMHRTYYSRKYNNSPMPHSIFFHGGYAIHGTNHIRNLGRPASHGCVRLHPDHARRLFDLVRRHGSSRTRIIVRN